MSIATDESYLNRQTGERIDKTEWHRIVTLQDGLIDMLERHAKKGRLVYIDGNPQTRRCSKPARTATASRPRSCWSRADAFSSWTARMAAARRRMTTSHRLSPQTP